MGLSAVSIVCLSRLSTYLFTATCCAQQDTHTVPGHQIGTLEGGKGAKDHSIKLIYCGHFEAVLRLARCFTNTVVSRSGIVSEESLSS